MKYILTAGWEDGIADLAERLTTELAADKQVLWLLSGGSNVPASVEVMENIPANLTKRLTLLLADERYGKPGHAESNWAKLLKAGLQLEQATALEILQPNASFAEATVHYNELAEQAFAAADVVVGQLGIGDDGHMAGLLPNLQLTTVTDTFVTSKSVPPYERMTLTTSALRRMNVVYAFAFGAPKRSTLEQLRSQTVPIDEQPAQLLKELPEVYIYNDQLGDTA